MKMQVFCVILVNNMYQFSRQMSNRTSFEQGSQKHVLNRFNPTKWVKPGLNPG